jgi:hypothetical protein
MDQWVVTDSMGDGGAGVVDQDDQAGVALVGELDDDGLGRVVDVPEDPLAVDVERARGDDAGDVRAGGPDPLGLPDRTGINGGPRTLASGMARRLLSAQSLSRPSISTTR